MQISEDTVVSVEYLLKDDEGNVIDQSDENRPMSYLHGHRNIIVGLEQALEGHVEGDSLDVRVKPEDGYGEPRPELEQVVPRERFQGIETLEPGMQFQASTEQGPISVRVVSVEDDDVTVDGNHPLAGKFLNFALTVKSVRQATEEELSHGHVHQESGCCGGEGESSCGCD